MAVETLQKQDYEITTKQPKTENTQRKTKKKKTGKLNKS